MLSTAESQQYALDSGQAGMTTWEDLLIEAELSV